MFRSAPRPWRRTLRMSMTSIAMTHAAFLTLDLERPHRLGRRRSSDWSMLWRLQPVQVAPLPGCAALQITCAPLCTLCSAQRLVGTAPRSSALRSTTSWNDSTPASQSIPGTPFAQFPAHSTQQAHSMPASVGGSATASRNTGTGIVLTLDGARGPHGRMADGPKTGQP